MTQPLWKFLLCLGLIAAPHSLVRLAAAPVAQAEIAHTSADLARQFQQLGREFRIQIYNNFRFDRTEYDRRRAAWNEVRQMWQTSGGRIKAKQSIIRWLQTGTRNSAIGTIAPLPQLPEIETWVTQPPAAPTIASQNFRLPHKHDAPGDVPGMIEAPPRSQPIPSYPPTRVRASNVRPLPRKRNLIVPPTKRRDIPLQAQAGKAPDSPASEVSPRKSLIPHAGSSTPRIGQTFSPLRGTITVAPRWRADDFAISRLRPTRSASTPNVSPDGPHTMNRVPATMPPVATAIADLPSRLNSHRFSTARRPAVAPQDVPLSTRRYSETLLKRYAGNVGPQSQDKSYAKPALRPTRPTLTPNVSRENRTTTGRPLQPAPAIASEPFHAHSPTPRVARRLIIEPRVEALPARKLTEPTLRRKSQPIDPPVQDGSFAKTILPASRKTTDRVIPPNHLASADRLPIRNRPTAPATAIELPPLAPPSQQAPVDYDAAQHDTVERDTVERAQINLIELAAHIAGYDRGLKTLENRLLLNERWTPRQLAQEVAELADLDGRRETIALYLQLLTPEVRETLQKPNPASTAAGLLERRIRETRVIVNRGSFPAAGDENRLDQEILDAAKRKLVELARPAGQP